MSNELLEAALSDLEKSEELNKRLYQELEQREKAYTQSLKEIVLTLNSSELDENSLRQLTEQEPLPKQLQDLEQGLENLQRSINSLQLEQMTLGNDLETFRSNFSEAWSNLVDKLKLS